MRPQGGAWAILGGMAVAGNSGRLPASSISRRRPLPLVDVNISVIRATPLRDPCGAVEGVNRFAIGVELTRGVRVSRQQHQCDMRRTRV